MPASKRHAFHVRRTVDFRELNGKLADTRISEVPVASVLFSPDLYPRLETSPLTVQKYAEEIAVLPPIEINQHRQLIDGWHRWTAHKKVGAKSIKIIVTPTQNDGQILELAIARNATHGLQLSQEEKREMARRIYHVTPERERDGKKRALAKILSVSDRTVRSWLEHIDKDWKQARNKRIFDLWMACHGQEEIAEIVGCERYDVDNVLRKAAVLPENAKAAAAHLIDFPIPLYNVWKQQNRTSGPSVFGNTEVRWLDNLLYLYTKPFDVVIDPFAGSGSSIDVCRKRWRRFWVADLNPIPERAHEIRKHDITVRLPRLPRWQDVSLVYLDPPYWKQAEGKYSHDPTDLSNMPLERFYSTLVDIIRGFAKKMNSGSAIALFLRASQWSEERYTDHVAEILRRVTLPLDMRVQCPYESEQCTAPMVEWAKANRKLLVLTRELVIWKIQ